MSKRDRDFLLKWELPETFPKKRFSKDEKTNLSKTLSTVEILELGLKFKTGKFLLIYSIIYVYKCTFMYLFTLTFIY